MLCGVVQLIDSYIKRLIASYLHDVLMASGSFLLALYLRLGGELAHWSPEVIASGLIIFTSVAAVVFLWFRLDRIIWRYASIGDLGKIIKAVALTIIIFLVCQFVYNRLADFPRSFLVIEFFVLTAFLAMPRLLYRLLKDRELSELWERNSHNRIPVLLIGAGDGTDLFIREMGRGRDAPYRAVGIIDEVGNRVGQHIRGVPILQNINGISNVIDSLKDQSVGPQRLLITESQIEGALVRKINKIAEDYGLAVARMPRVSELNSSGDESYRLMPRPIDVEDILGRPQNVQNLRPVSNLVEGSRILITGAGGTIGSELTRQIAQFLPSEIALFESAEYSLYQADLELGRLFPNLKHQTILGDVRDENRIREIFSEFKPDIVLHSAALKHVPLAETNPVEAILTNVIGTRNVADASIKTGVKCMVLISTDKAVDPCNVMGATKRLAEAYCQALDICSGVKKNTRFVTVRFGNVLGSTGSVIPLFESQIAAGGPVTVTHQDITRYFMTLREAVCLVLQAAAMVMRSGEVQVGSVQVLDMGEPVRIIELAQQMIRLSGLTPEKDISIKITGLRPGEKLHEELIHSDESLTPTQIPGISNASPRTSNLADLKEAFSELHSTALSRNVEQSLLLLKTLVPEFQSKE